MSESERLAEIAGAHRQHYRGVAVMIFVAYWAVIFTYRDFFFFNPLASGGPLRQASLWLALIGWLLAAIGTPVAMFAASHGSELGLKLMPYTALWWPVSVLVSQVVLLVTTGVFYGGYLANFPIFWLTDLAIPAYVVYKWWVLHRTLQAHAAHTAEAATAEA